MDWISKFYDLLEENKKDFKLMSHMHSGYGETMIKVTADGALIMHIVDEDYDNCFRRAYEDLEFYVKTRREKIDSIIAEFKLKWQEEA